MAQEKTAARETPKTIDVERLLRLADAVWNRRQSLDALFEEIAAFMFPERKGFQGKGSARDDIFDATAEEVNNTLAAALHSLLTNPASKWFSLQIAGMAEKRELTHWLEQVEDRMLDVFNDPATGFANEVASLYLDIGPFGWGVFGSEDEAGTGIRFRALPPYECAIAEDRHGRVNTLVRRYSLGVGEAFELFGQEAFGPNGAGESWKQRLESDPLAQVSVVHVVLPLAEVERWGQSPARSSAGFAHSAFSSPLPQGPALSFHALPGLAKPQYLSVYLDKEARRVLHQGCFYEFPFQVPRWSKASGDVYGRGPGWTALPDVRVLNAVSESQLMAAEKQADPPLLVPDDGVLGKIRTFSGGITYYRPGSGDIMPLPVASDLGTMQNVRQEKQDAIRRAFLNDRILMANGPQMTATEVLSRENKQMLVLGPVLGRLQSEFLGPLVERVFGMLLRRGDLPSPPLELAENPLRVRYVSPISRAQKQVEASAFVQAMQYLAPLLQMAPDLVDQFDTDAIARDSQKLFCFPASYLRESRDVTRLRHSRAQASQIAELANLVPPLQ